MASFLMVRVFLVGCCCALATGACGSDDKSSYQGGVSGQGGQGQLDAGAGDADASGQSDVGGQGGQGMGGKAGAAGAADGGRTWPAGCGPEKVSLRCNPVTNEGCDTASGEACDLSLEDESRFQCFPGPINTIALGQACNQEFDRCCQATGYCDYGEEPDGICRKYCCSNDDCPAASTCKPLAAEYGTLGRCI